MPSKKIIENKYLRVETSVKGAELTSIYSKITKKEYLWQAGKEWAKHAPVLFPIVGQLKDNTYIHNSKKYQLPRHGFARDNKFEIDEQFDSIISYILKPEKFMNVYPFQYNFRVMYVLMKKQLSVLFEIENKGDEAMYFSVGGHPAFNVPLNANEKYDDYYLEFSRKENASRYLLKDGLLTGETRLVLDKTKVLPLNKELFYDDALVFKNLKSKKITLKSNASSNGLIFFTNEFDSLGIWAAKDANFVCIEPWMGHADFVNHNQEIKEKEGIKKLPPNDVFSCSFQIEPF